MKMYDIARTGSRLLLDARAEIGHCEEQLSLRIAAACRAVPAARGANVVMLSGPSGAGKTTTAQLLCRELERCGVPALALSMDDYFIGHSQGPLPVDEQGCVDLESPERLDIPLVRRDIGRLLRGLPIDAPRFDFTLQERAPKTHRLHPHAQGIVLFEGIHALNPDVAGPDCPGLYADTGSGFAAPDGSVLPPDRLRLLRRISRDRIFRGREPEHTLRMFASVSRGERLYITPHRHRALACIDTAMAYELGLYRTLVLPYLPDGGEHAALCAELRWFLQKAVPVQPCDVPRDSLLREFIGNEGL